MFGVSQTKCTRRDAKRAESIAKRHGADLVEAFKLPGVGYQRWFTAPNLGAPFDDATRDAVQADLDAAGVFASRKAGV